MQRAVARLFDCRNLALGGQRLRHCRSVAARGATALNLFVAIQFLRATTPRFLSVSASLFAVSIAAYGLASSDAVAEALGASVVSLVIPAVLAAAFFWWFALALFRDGSGWRWAYAAPPALLLAFYGIRMVGRSRYRASCCTRPSSSPFSSLSSASP